jgi:hypothetical protein
MNNENYINLLQEQQKILEAIFEQGREQQKILQAILDSLNKPKLGFTDDAGTIYIYCNRQHGYLWYSLDADRKPVSIESAALTGYLDDLKFEKVERRGKEVYKLLVKIRADRTYILESGHDSQFSKGVIAAIATLAPENLRQPITIKPSAGDDESVLFARLYLGNETIKSNYNENSDFRALSKQALEVVRLGKVV